MPGLPTKLYECHVTGVRESERLIDVESLRTGQKFSNVSYLLPWISSVGSGFDCVPRVKDKCLVLATDPRPNQGFGGRVVVCIGFQVPLSDGTGELGERISGLPQGSMVMRSVAEDGSEALVMTTRGGTVLVKATETCRTLYSRLDSTILHVFDNWKMTGPGGHVRWERDRDKVKYHAQYQVTARNEAGDFRVNVDIDEGDSDPVSVTVGNGGDRPFLQVRVDSNGQAHIEGESINIRGRAGVSIDGAEVKIKGRQVLGQGDPI